MLRVTIPSSRGRSVTGWLDGTLDRRLSTPFSVGYDVVDREKMLLRCDLKLFSGSPQLPIESTAGCGYAFQYALRIRQFPVHPGP